MKQLVHLPIPSVSDPIIELLMNHATRFRQAIERCDRNRLSVCMQNFPYGSCGDATLLLGTYLAEKGLGQFAYALGERPTDDPHRCQSHAWLEGIGLIVDITADQFPEITAAVIVTRQSDWHAAFERDEFSHAADYRIYDPRTVAMLGQAYSAVLREMDQL